MAWRSGSGGLVFFVSRLGSGALSVQGFGALGSVFPSLRLVLRVLRLGLLSFGVFWV